jgi:hypothetical protein
MTTREPVIGRTVGVIAVGIFLIAAGSLVMTFPVSLNAYDRWGFTIVCGNAFKLDSTHAVLVDQQPGAEAADSRTYVAQCRHAVALRRLWTIPPVAIGGAIVTIYACAGVLSSESRSQRRTKTAAAQQTWLRGVGRRRPGPATPTDSATPHQHQPSG